MFDRIINKGITIPTDFRPLCRVGLPLFAPPLFFKITASKSLTTTILSLADPLVSTLLS